MRDLLYREPRLSSMRELQAKLVHLLENVEMITIRRMIPFYIAVDFALKLVVVISSSYYDVTQTIFVALDN